MTKKEAAATIKTRYPALDLMVGARAILVSDLHKLGAKQDECRSWLSSAGFDVLGSGATLLAENDAQIEFTPSQAGA